MFASLECSLDLVGYKYRAITVVSMAVGHVSIAVWTNALPLVAIITMTLLLAFMFIRHRYTQQAQRDAALTYREAEARREREFTESLLASIAPDVFFVTDPTNHILRCNDALVDLFGWSREELLGQTTARLYTSLEDYLTQIPTVAQETLRHGRMRFEHLFVTRAGRPIRMEANITWVETMRVFIVVARDITARHAMEQQLEIALRESEQARNDLLTVFDAVQDALVVYDAAYHPLHRNEAYRQLFESAPYGPQLALVPGSALRYSTADGIEVATEDAPLVKALTTQAPVAMTLQIQRPDDSGLTALVHVTPLRAEQGVINGALCIIRDVTEAQRNARDIEIMRAVAHACASAASETEIALAALAVLTAGFGIPNGLIMMRNGERPGYARALAAHLTNDAWIRNFITQMEATPIASDAVFPSLCVLATGEALFDCASPLYDAEGHDLINPVPYCVPLTIDDVVVGALTLSYSEHSVPLHTQADHELMLAVADEIAISLHRARLYEEARRLALFDPLTGLRNHRALQDVLQQELTTGTLRGLPVSLIMLDVDHFRKFNEMYGHDVGDRALRNVAQAIQSVLAENAFAARYGGEEFTVLLPATDSQRADEIAQQIHGAITARLISVSNAEVSLTASIGHATFPMHASAPASLLKAADMALYAAKRGGRNCIVAYTPNLLYESPRLLIPLDAATPDDASELFLPTGADLDAVQALITAIDLRDGYTAAHSDGVSRYAVAIANEMGLPAEHVEALRLGALIHDVGKIGVPDQILRKPGKLTDEEWVLMRAHTTMGEEILRPVEQLHHLLPLVRWHHERLDGSGYPDGLRGNQIAPLVRILSVADVFEAFTAERPYHPGRPARDGLQLLKQEVASGHMDGAIVAAFEELLLCQGLIEELPDDDVIQAAA